MLKVVSASASLVLAAVLFACSGGTATVGGSSTPVENGEVTATSGMKVEATIASVTLGDECGGSAGAPSSDFAGKCADDSPNCGGSFCQQSNVQIAFTSGAGSAAAKIEVVAVTLLDASTGTTLDELTASNPQQWNPTSGYLAWNESIAPKTELKASYSLSAPSWSTIGEQSYSRKFRVNVTLRIDGTQIVLESEILSREPAVAT